MSSRRHHRGYTQRILPQHLYRLQLRNDRKQSVALNSEEFISQWHVFQILDKLKTHPLAWTTFNHGFV